MIRPVDIQDADEIKNIYNHYVEHSTATFEEECIDANEMLKRIEKVTKLNLPWLVLVVDNKILAYAYATPWKERSAYRYSVESTVYCAANSLGQGLGLQLYTALLAELKSLPIHSVMGGITLPNPASVALHEKLGMTKVAHFKQIGKKFDQWLDTGYWQLNL